MANPPAACRKLFVDGNDDDEEEEGGQRAAASQENARNFLNEEMRRDYEAKCLKWNFNFKEGVPLPGDWEWESMIEDEPDGDVEVKEVVESAGTTNGDRRPDQTAARQGLEGETTPREQPAQD